MKQKLLTLLLAVFLISSCDLENPGGVLTYNELPNSVIEFFDKTDILENEQIIAYYDVTVVLDNSESAILTNKNLIYYKYGRIERFPLNSIVSIEEEDCFGLCIVASTIASNTAFSDLFTYLHIFIILFQSAMIWYPKPD